MYKVNGTKDIAEIFQKQLEYGHFVKDRNGGNTIEILGASFVADEPAIFGTPNEEYIKAEIDWYESQSTNITDIYPEGDKQPPEAWQHTANVHGEINSNYGHLLYSDKYYNQRGNALQELLTNPDSRRASMIYQRPSICKEYNENGKSDFICTNAVTYYIRDGYLHASVQMRSNDVIFGYRNDYAWQKYVQDDLLFSLNEILIGDQKTLEPGYIYWQVQNLHVYERHFDLVK